MKVGDRGKRRLLLTRLPDVEETGVGGRGNFAGLSVSKARVPARAHFWPGEYVILDRKVGRKISINPGEQQTDQLQ